jgi:glycosyltransferase involved in cell wall biosynthesis
VDEIRKQPFLAEVAALLFPIKWPEPFGLAVIEATACGTPEIAYRGVRRARWWKTGDGLYRG